MGPIISPLPHTNPNEKGLQEVKANIVILVGEKKVSEIEYPTCYQNLNKYTYQNVCPYFLTIVVAKKI